MPTLLQVPAFFPIADAHKYGLPASRAQIYELLRRREIRAKKDGRRTLIEGASVIERHQRLPDFIPDARRVGVRKDA